MMRVYLVTLVLIFAIFQAIRPDEVYKSCSKIKKRYWTNHVSVNSRELNIKLYWGSDPARVAATIFRVMAKHALRYQKILLKKGNHTLEVLKKEVLFNKRHTYEDVILALSTAWDGKDEKVWEACEGQSINIAGPRLYDYGASLIPARQRLHVHIANPFQDREHCWRIATSTEWDFYTNTTYTDCGFHNPSVSNQRIVYELDPKNKIITEELTKRANSFSRGLKFETINRTSLFQNLRTGNQSFFFVDYDIWEGDIDVRGVQLPPCIPKDELPCQEELDNIVALRVGDIYSISKYAPPLFSLAYHFTVSPETIRTLLEHESNATHIEDAACDWVLENDHIIDTWLGKTEYTILVFYCLNDMTDYIKEVVNLFFNKSEKIFGEHIHYDTYLTNCSDKNFVREKIQLYLTTAGSQGTIGVVVGNMNISTTSAKTLDKLNLPVLVYDAVNVDDHDWTSVWFTNGRSVHLALAMSYFFVTNAWNRVTIISDATPTAKALVDSLAEVQKENGNNTVPFYNHPYFSPQDAKTVLQELKDENARIILVNTNYEDAFNILSEAVSLEMNAADQYVWIVRDWRPSNRSLDITHFMISFWSQSRDKALSSTVQQNSWGSENSWPPYAVPLADAILTLGHTFLKVLKKYPQAQYDAHSDEFIKQFEKTIVDSSPVQGVTQNLSYKEHYLEETLVLLDEWRSNKPELLTVWRVNATAKSVDEQHVYRETYNGTAPNDGTQSCILSSKPAYHQTCYDKAALSGLILLLLMPPAIFLAIRLVRRHIKRHENKIIFKIMVGRQQRAAQLSGYLIDRSQLEMRIELGAGRFGCVRLALLRRPGSPRKFVAAKSLRDLQDEREILREACTLASLAHPHIIRLVGICIDNEPPLMLMEVAFYGDLLHYLRSRRYLVNNIVTESAEDINEINEEAFHVSTEALTKLARQAASALGYLSFRGVIHRDLRAANCLMDVNRSLKLADFGMAREIAAETEDGDAEYACKRRGLFPVPWMAPESLENGVFSTASDMWALGVLVFELVTLGAHPYGNMSPLRVIHFVTKGGKPSMPRDVTPQTSGLAHLCWQSDPEQRPTAAEVVAYLADRPSALRPALLPDEMKSVEVDSGYGATPELETLIPILLLSDAEMLEDQKKVDQRDSDLTYGKA